MWLPGTVARDAGPLRDYRRACLDNKEVGAGGHRHSDHWHALMFKLTPAGAGKDVYVEKPLSLR